MRAAVDAGVSAVASAGQVRLERLHHDDGEEAETRESEKNNKQVEDVYGEKTTNLLKSVVWIQTRERNTGEIVVLTSTKEIM